jgi:3-phosphoshikimate 1-carboxyvinyltransferase
MKVGGTVRVPGDKSISHRALMLAAVAPGTSRVTGVLDSADVRSTALVLRALGADVPDLAPMMAITGRADGLSAPAADLDCGNSGTTTRLVAGLVAARPIAARFVGDASLSRRPMRRVARPLEKMGARVAFEGEDGRLPMTVHGGALGDVEWTSDTASAQVKSAVLLAGVTAGVEVTVREPHRSRDHTERMLAARGVDVYVNEQAVHVPAGQRIGALDVAVPGDPSSAAFLAALAAIADSGTLTLPDVCLNDTRAGFFRALARMGARLEVDDERREGGEEVGTIYAHAGRPLRGIDVAGDEVPAMIDELPLLACVAACADGETTVRGAAELRVKESDRIAAVVHALRAVGADAEELPDGFVVRGAPGRVLAGPVATHGDHRLAMGFGILGARPGNRIVIDDPACVGVSYPRFWSDLAAALS